MTRACVLLTKSVQIHTTMEKWLMAHLNLPAIQHHRRYCNRPLVPVLLVLGACTTSPPLSAPPPPAAPVVARPSPPEQRVRDTTWQFRSVQEGCSAIASDRLAAFEASVDSAKITFALRPSTVVRTSLRTRPAVNLSFSGRAGEWRIAAVGGADGAITVQQPLDEVAAGRVLALLGGGIAAAEGRGVVLPQLRLPASGSAGWAWFECVRRLLLQ